MPVGFGVVRGEERRLVEAEVAVLVLGDADEVRGSRDSSRATASSIAVARLLRELDRREVAGERLRGVRRRVVRGDCERSSGAARSRRRRAPAPWSARPCASCAVETVTGPEFPVRADERERHAGEQARHDVRGRGHRERAGTGTDRELARRPRSLTETSPPVPALNSEPATLRSCSTPVVVEVSCSRYWFVPTCTALASTPAFGGVDVGDDGAEAAVAGRDVRRASMRAGAQAAREHRADRARGRVQRDRLPGGDVGDGLHRAAVDLHLAVGAGERGAVGRQVQRAERVAAGDLERRRAALFGGRELERAGVRVDRRGRPARPRSWPRPAPRPRAAWRCRCRARASA